MYHDEQNHDEPCQHAYTTAKCILVSIHFSILPNLSGPSRCHSKSGKDWLLGGALPLAMGNAEGAAHHSGVNRGH